MQDEKYRLSRTAGIADGVEDPQIFENLILTVKDVARLLRLSTKTVYKRARRGEIPCKRIGDEYRFLLPELMGWLKGQ